MSHTPGPWTVDRRQGSYDEEDYPEVMGFRTSAFLYRQNREIVEANARLIAAAPELLDALRAIIYASDGCQGHRGCDHSMEPWRQARELLHTIDGDD